jgi:hypothetical protein
MKHEPSKPPEPFRYIVTAVAAASLMFCVGR